MDNFYFINSIYEIEVPMKLSIHHIMIILIAMAIIVLLFPILFPKKYEAFENTVGYFPIDNTISRDDYMEIGRKRYNRLSDPVDVLSPGPMGINLTSEQRVAMDEQIKDALGSIQLIPTTANGLSYREPTYIESRNAVPPLSGVIEKVKKCESQLGRDKCAMLDNPDFADCGICIRGGTDVFNKRPDNHVGGLFITQKERQRALKNPLDTSFQKPSAGKCAPGYFFLNSDDCKAASERLNCQEIAETGGFSGGITTEGKNAIQANCAQCGTDDKKYVFTAPNYRTSNIRLRIVVPTGSGTNVVRIFNNAGELLGEGRNADGETEFVVMLDSNKPLAEAEEISIQVNQEFPHRPPRVGVDRREVFFVDLGESGFTSSILEAKRAAGDKSEKEEGFTFEEAQSVCRRLGGSLATESQLRAANNAGLQSYNYGFISGGQIWSSTRATLQTDKYSLPSGARRYSGTVRKTYAGAWCFGIKPPSGRYKSLDFDIVVKPFFSTFLNESVPSQETSPNQSSQFGIDFVAPNYRGIILQWESNETNVQEAKRVRVPMDSTITKINGFDAKITAGILRRKGRFDTSEQISSPRSGPNSVVSSTTYWFWSNNNMSTNIIISAKCPGILKQPMYMDDRSICVGKPLIANKDTLDLLRVSVCNRPNETPGNFSIECLEDLFKSTGGSLSLGELSPSKSQANRNTIMKFTSGVNRNLAQIGTYLANLYQIATTGRTLEGWIAGYTKEAELAGNLNRARISAINTASKQLFGKELVSPCEEIFDSGGEIMIRNKEGPFSPECLNHLYNNAGYDKQRGNEGSRTTTEGATYTSIGQRFSGMVREDVGNAQMKKEFPFRTCQPSGTIAPIKPDGSQNMDAIMAANAAGNSVLEIQNFYDTIYREANKSYNQESVEPEIVEKQRISMERCYGIQKVDDILLPTGCGVRARYVRIVNSNNGEYDFYVKNQASAAEKENEIAPILTISQIVVMDPKGANISRGKPISFSSQEPGSNPRKVVDGVSSSSRTSLSDIYSSDSKNIDSRFETNSEFFMIDLQRPTEVRSVEYIYGGDPIKQFRAWGYIIQLLDESMNVITQKVMNRWDFPNQGSSKYSVTKTFYREDVLPDVNIATLKHNDMYDLINFAFARDATNSNDKTFISRVILEREPTSTAPLGSFKIKLVTDENIIRYFTINEQGQFTILNTDGRAPLTDWYIRPAFNGTKTGITIESANQPGRYLINSYYTFLRTTTANQGSSNTIKAIISLFGLRRPNSNIF